MSSTRGATFPAPCTCAGIRTGQTPSTRSLGCWRSRRRLRRWWPAPASASSTTVVVYDDGHVTVAARLWWALRVYGHAAVAVLDGGIGRWVAEGRPLSPEVPSWPKGDFVARPRSAAYATHIDVAAALDDPSAGLVDCRMEPARVEDGAMIPGSSYLPGIEFLDDEGVMRSPESCRETILAATEPSSSHDPVLPGRCGCLWHRPRLRGGGARRRGVGLRRLLGRVGHDR